VIAFDTILAVKKSFATELIGKNLIFFLKKPIPAGTGRARGFFHQEGC
jgi:hypothetical protein